MKVKAPAKLILSGEHAVVYGCPALAIAIDRYINIDIDILLSPEIAFDFKDLYCQSYIPIADFPALRDATREKYQEFLAGQCKISEVIDSPRQLAPVALSLLFEEFPYHLSSGMNITIESNIAIGSGMGSSAAMIISLLFAVDQYLQLNLSKETLYRYALQAENMQHGKSSGIDLLVSLLGGCIYRHNDQLTLRPAPAFIMYVVNTGVPISTTGECVAQVAKHFHDARMSDAFSAVTREMARALQQNNFMQFKQVIQRNHQLLSTIGVVPDKVQQFIAAIEQTGGAAKICGAGAINGDQAGTVLAVVDDESLLQKISDSYGYSFFPLQCVTQGVHVV